MSGEVSERDPGRLPRGDDDRAVGGTGDRPGDASPEPAPPRAENDQLCVAVARELDDPPLRRALEDLGFGFDLGDSCDAEGAIQHAPREFHLLAQPSLVEGRAEKRRRAVPNVDEDERRFDVGGKG